MRTPLHCTSQSSRRAVALAGVGALLLGLATGHGSAIAAPGPVPGAAPREASRAPAPWRADQHQRRSRTAPPHVGTEAQIGDAVPVMMAGSLAAFPPDDPDQRIDANTSGSPYAGVCSLFVQAEDISGLCTGTPITPYHILTAGHCFDLYSTGYNAVGTNVTIRFNVAGDASHVITPSGVRGVNLHPDFTGFSNPAVNDDLAIITLKEPLPPEIPIYPVYRGELADASLLHMVGYGQSGHGDQGPVIDATTDIKRLGWNEGDLFVGDDESSGVLEVFITDFDGPNNGPSCFGGPSLGNDLEAGVAPGDSGGPSFIEVDGALKVWGVNTFGSSCAGPVFQFGSRSGGMVTTGYLAWIDAVVECGGTCEDCNENGVPDGFDLMDGDSADVNFDLVPDECQAPDIDANDVILSNFFGLHAWDSDSGTAEQILASMNLSAISSIRHDAAGGVFVVGRNFGIAGVWRLDTTTGTVSEVATEADGLQMPRDVAWSDDGSMYVLNIGTFNQPVGFITRHDPVTGDWLETVVADDPDTPEAENGGLMNPRELAFGPDGDMFVNPQAIGIIGLMRFDGLTGAFEGFFAEDYPEPSIISFRTFQFRDGILYATVWPADNILRFDATTGDFIDILLQTEELADFFPTDFDIDNTGRIIVVSQSPTWQLLAFDLATGAFQEVLLDMSEPPFQNPGHLMVMPAVAVTGDLDGNGIVDAADLQQLLATWGVCPDDGPCPADLTGDGTIDAADLSVLLAHWG